MMENDRILDTKRVAELLGISPAGVRMLVYRGILPARRLGGKYVFLLSEVLEAMQPVNKQKT